MSKLPEWARALGSPLFAGRIRDSFADFIVVEELDIEFTASGEHDWLLVKKTDANTHWVAAQLARHAQVPERDVGYAGLKDRRAVTTQWFSVRRLPGAAADWSAFDAAGVTVLDIRRHQRKLRRGAHSGNAFRIAIRSDDPLPREQVVERLQRIDREGVPNYFGEQRFGRDGGNIELGEAVLAGRRLSRHKRSLGISALRSLRFNEELDARVQAQTWNTLLPGDMVNLDGSGSVFAADAVTPDLERRCAEMDVHPCGTLPGFESLRVEPGTRPLRTRVAKLQWEFADDALRVEFRLGRGSFATAVLREIAALA